MATRRSDPPEVRRDAAGRALERLPPADVTIWSDELARECTNHGGQKPRSSCIFWAVWRKCVSPQGKYAASYALSW